MNRTAYRFPQPADALSFSGERYVSGLLGNADSGDIQSEHYHRYLFALRFCHDKDVLDIASGEGYGSHLLGQTAHSVIGVDADDGAVSFANHNYLSDRVSFKTGIAQALPITDASIDVVVSYETLEHFTDHDAFAAEVRRVLRPGGLLVISSPNRTVYTEQADYHNEWHLRELDRNEFLTYLETNFAHVRLFAQRPLIGSVIARDDGPDEGGLEGFILRDKSVFHQTEGVPQPPFFLALASDTELPLAPGSVLQNPSLLLHVETQRQQAVELATKSSAHAQDLEAVLNTSRNEHAKLEAALIAATESGRAETRKVERQFLDTRRELARALEQSKQREAAIIASQAADRAALQEDMRGQQNDLRGQQEALRGQQEDLRQELVAAQRWNVTLNAELHSLRVDRDHLAESLAVVSDSTAWKLTRPLRQLGSVLPPTALHGMRFLTRPNKWRSLRRRRVAGDTSQALAGPEPAPMLPQASPNPPGVAGDTLEVLAEPPEPVPMLPQAPPRTPSDQQRLHDPAWVTPDERPEFVRLRNSRPAARIAVVAHVYYSDLWPEMAEAILNIPDPFDLFVTLVTEASHHLACEIHRRFPNAQVLIVDNHGRDIFPFLALLRTGVLFNYDLICKLHSKRSLYREGGDQWRQHLIGGILGTPTLVQKILDAFRADGDLGIVVADGQMFGGHEYWVSNEARVRDLCQNIGLNSSAFEQSFVGGSMYWIRPLILRPINALNLNFDDFEPEPISNDGYTAHAVERLVSLVCYDAGMHAGESAQLNPLPLVTPSRKLHVIANYLPQFHPIPENSAWWGEGFTEWSNVTKAAPLFRGHRQPRLPTDLGFYDLRLSEAREAQAKLARTSGITAFSYYYYWFNGRRLLNLPLDQVVSSGAPDFPFMLCWANEPWTRNWDGLSEEILLSQDYLPNWENSFAADVAKVMRDPRYLRFNDKPMLALYRVAHIPDARGSVRRLRSAFADEGFPDLHLIGAWVQIGSDKALPPDARDLGLDAYFEFPPHNIPSKPLDVCASDRIQNFAALVYDYGATVDAVIDQLASGNEGFRHRAVMMGWDNTARRGNKSFVFHGATPANFRRWLRAAIKTARSEAPGSEAAVFINAWNEWAEGTYLEPDRDFGTGWLEAVASATADARDMIASPTG
ncbi:glycoside hydrolase family 99-like domain-containing protein [Rhodopila sp.]|uniref:glycoside hydrolase family 99-like domain-containing protein n=1 Tax=Rhodopila sp. TaxID=2480087 RepID=UPI003D0BF006